MVTFGLQTRDTWTNTYVISLQVEVRPMKVRTLHTESSIFSSSSVPGLLQCTYPSTRLQAKSHEFRSGGKKNPPTKTLSKTTHGTVSAVTLPCWKGGIGSPVTTHLFKKCQKLAAPVIQVALIAHHTPTLISCNAILCGFSPVNVILRVHVITEIKPRFISEQNASGFVHLQHSLLFHDVS